MKIKSLPDKSKALLLAGMLTLSISISAQNPSLKVFEDWRTEAGTQNTFFRAGAVSVPGTTNSVVYGATLNANGNYDMLVQKLNSTGNVLWSYQYNGPGNGDDVAADVYYDASTDYAYIAGSYFENSSDSLNAILIALDPTGVLDWSVTHNGAGSGADGFSDVELDAGAGELYCTGTEWAGLSTMYDVLIEKYDITGSLIWSNSFDFMSMIDGGTQLVLSAKPGVMCVGQNGPTSFRYGLVKFNPSSGGVLGAAMGGGTAMGYDRAADVAVDDTGNVYLVGSVYNSSTWSDIRVTKYDTLLNIVWEYDVDAGYNLDDYASGIALDGYNNVIITGTSRTVFNGLNYTVIKYTNAGNIVFYDSYDGIALGNDSAAAVVINPNDTNAIYVTGYSFNGSTNDYRTIRYDGAGNHLWEISMNSILNGDDKATAIALDTLGNVIVTGQTKVADTVYAYTTVRYVEKEVMMPMDTIAGASNSFVYTANAGQVLGTDSAQHNELKYYTINANPRIYFSDTLVSYVIARMDTSSAHADSLARVDMHFVTGNAARRIFPMSERSDYCNFFLGHLPEGRSRVQNYDQLYSDSVWNGIDVIYSSNLAGFKYYFICKPIGGGSSASSIDLYYEGADSVKIGPSGELIIFTPLGNIIQPKAAAWQLDINGNYQSLGWQPSYNIVGTNRVKFTSFGSFNTALPIVIAVDRGTAILPTSVGNQRWGTYYGGGGDFIFDLHTSTTGSMLTCGSSVSPYFPVSIGALYGNLLGGFDATINKFRPNHSMMWSTYFGGNLKLDSTFSAFDEAYGIATDALGNVFITGNTQSIDFPITPWAGAYMQTTLPSISDDAYIAKLDSNGVNIIWCTYYGGVGIDKGTDIQVSGLNGDIYVVGLGQSGFPTYNAPPWSNGEGFIAHFSSSGVRQWVTSVGNTNTGYVRGVAIDAVGDVVVVGRTGLGGGGYPIVNAGGNAVYGGGGADAFMLKLDAPIDTLLWSTYWGGINPDDAYGVVASPPGGPVNYFVVGSTDSPKTGAFPPLIDPGGSAFYDTVQGGMSDAFLTQFSQNGTIMWSTYLGSSQTDRGMSIGINRSSDIFISGRTMSSGFPVQPMIGNFYDPNINGTEDAYVLCFRSGVHDLIWGSFIGGNSSEQGYAVACYKDSTLYLAGSTVCATNFPLDPGNGTPYYDDSIVGFKGYILAFSMQTIVNVRVQEQQAVLEPVILAYPNPASSALTVSGTLPSEEGVTVEIVDLYGRVVYSHTLPKSSQINHQIDISNLANGAYVMRVSSQEWQINQKVLINR